MNILEDWEENGERAEISGKVEAIPRAPPSPPPSLSLSLSPFLSLEASAEERVINGYISQNIKPN